ncbi:PREDICTED: enhancer of split mgamma protein-like [Dufourea novaeangliae]|uniref:enhancer of split mgamma protein-like n=1 Tax=Dufourea novaeangliae TaxID=178035 RepID=UPI0007678B73|nr:PREDICTED: enhancer of split mgamma protein-like [Dufourea novaeangliae]
MMSFNYPHPVSRTHQYKKVTKPLLERKRRARINKCLDELKNLMIDALETEGEDISKLEKADILELTVRHLQRLQGLQSSGLSGAATKNDEISAESRWLSGFGRCAAEAYRFLSALPGEGAERLARYLAAGLQKGRPTSSPLKTNTLPLLTGSFLGNAAIQDTRVTSSNQSTVTNCETSNNVVTTNILVQCNSVMSVNNSEELTSNCVAHVKDLRYEHASDKVKVKFKVEDEEEIDVERVDKQDHMWRPW